MPVAAGVVGDAQVGLPKPFRALALTLAFGQADIDELARTQLVETRACFENT
jgi:hypothetical protein